MWPHLLEISPDDCRRTLRCLEVGAYSNMISVLRAQGALEDNRKKLLEELRAVLHISNDRHRAEARRVANDQLLATIAYQLKGPNTKLGWSMEGKRKVPLMPRGVPQTSYTVIADKFSSKNEEFLKNIDEVEPVTLKTDEEENTKAVNQAADDDNSSMELESSYPVALDDPAIKIWETELVSRKRKNTESSSTDDATTPIKNVRNIPANPNQKHLNLSQLYSKFSQPATSKPLSQSKHSYNQVSKVSTSKSSQQHNSSAGPTKHRTHKSRNKNPAQIVISKSQMKKSQEIIASPSKQYSPMQLEYAAQQQGSFQASYAQSVLGHKGKFDFIEDRKAKVVASAGRSAESATMQLLTQGAEAGPEPAHPHSTSISGKPSQLVIKKRGEITTDRKLQVSDIKIVHKPDTVKLLSSRPMVATPSSTQKVLTSSGKLVTTKVIGPAPKSQNLPFVTPEKMIVVSKPITHTSVTNSKIIVTSSAVSTPISKDTVLTSTVSPRVAETITAKGIPATDIKVSAKTFLLNPKSGQKMVVVPAKAKQHPEGHSVPVLHFKGMPTAMRLVPVSSQPGTPVTKSTAMTVVSKASIINTKPSHPKVLSVEPIKTANMADIVPVKGMTPISTPKSSSAIVRPSSAKGSVIVVQKGTALGKTLSFNKNGSDMSKIIMGKNVNKLLQASKQEQTESAKGSGNVIVLELNNDQTAQTTTMSEILDSRNTNTRTSDEGTPVTNAPKITEDTPVVFDSQIAVEACNTSSLDSTAESIGDIVPIGSTLPTIDKTESLTIDKTESFTKEADSAKDVGDWDIELDSVPTPKEKDDDDKLNSLHLDLGMSSDSDTDYIADGRKSKRKHSSSQDSLQGTTPSIEGREPYESSSGLSLATRAMLSQLQDDGSSSNDSSFALKSKSIVKLKEADLKTECMLDKSESEALKTAKQKLSEKVAKSQQKRIDIYSTAISSTDINLDSFSYLDEGMLAGDEDERREQSLHDHLTRMLAEDSQASNDSQTVSDIAHTNK